MESVHCTGVWSMSQMLTVTVASAAFWMEGWRHFESAAPCLALADASCSEAGAVIGAIVAALVAAVVGIAAGAAVGAVVGAAVGAAVCASEATLLMSCADSR